MNVIDLFSGCGGFSLGFEKAGYNVLLGIDIWKDALITFEKNHKDAKVLEGSLTEISGEKILKYINKDKSEIDVIVGGPPCQGFSVSGKRILEDPRNELYKSFVQVVDTIQPKVFVMENVPGLVRLFNGEAKDRILESLENIGYNVSYKILTASDYGVPQTRKRVFFVGLRKDLFDFPNDYFEFPTAEYGDSRKYPFITSKEAIDDLPLLEGEIGEEMLPYPCPPKNTYQELMRKDSLYISNHIATVHKPKTVETIARVPDGGNYRDLPKELWETRKVNIAWTRMNSKKPCFTIDTGHNHHFHYKANRVPTVRESARIQSFPDDFIFYGTKTSQLKQVGNAVPPILSRALAEKIKTLIKTKEMILNEL
ncbi:DNA cytosine methyltransferase [Bacillaceae bacterium CLA-AA-H227]|uniref:DNA cytosine methyltransferase n=1 Tax=Robertmurraya yapensis (ex Hitch et al 2024) TaxID=3133160 RepID=A0ACC6S5P5_9BACI